jgi:hypothetical protein
VASLAGWFLSLGDQPTNHRAGAVREADHAACGCASGRRAGRWPPCGTPRPQPIRGTLVYGPAAQSTWSLVHGSVLGPAFFAMSSSQTLANRAYRSASSALRRRARTEPLAVVRGIHSRLRVMGCERRFGRFRSPPSWRWKCPRPLTGRVGKVPWPGPDGVGCPARHSSQEPARLPRAAFHWGPAHGGVPRRGADLRLRAGPSLGLRWLSVIPWGSKRNTAEGGCSASSMGELLRYQVSGASRIPLGRGMLASRARTGRPEAPGQDQKGMSR